MEPIDFVLTWVDGNDPAWQAEKQQYSPNAANDSATANRYRDWGLLQYWFRAIEKFTPWVNKVHFVTWGHLPEFLNTDHPKLHIVNHKDYLPADCLPTFNSIAIEMSLHKIEGLSEQFVFLNDDTYITRSMSPECFFRKGLPCVYGCETPAVPASNGIWQYLFINDMVVVNRYFSKSEQMKKYWRKFLTPKYRLPDFIRACTTALLFPQHFLGFVNVHAPSALLKSTFEKVWEAEPELLKRTTANRFRTQGDVNQWLLSWWQAASGNFYPYRVDNEVMPANNETIDELCRMITKQSHDMLCINDPDGDIDFDSLSNRLKSAFEQILPEKSSFEK